MGVQDLLLLGQVTNMVFVEMYPPEQRWPIHLFFAACSLIQAMQDIEENNGFSSIHIHKIVTHICLHSFALTAIHLPPPLILPLFIFLLELSSDF